MSKDKITHANTPRDDRREQRPPADVSGRYVPDDGPYPEPVNGRPTPGGYSGYGDGR